MCMSVRVCNLDFPSTCIVDPEESVTPYPNPISNFLRNHIPRTHTLYILYTFYTLTTALIGVRITPYWGTRTLVPCVKVCVLETSQIVSWNVYTLITWFQIHGPRVSFVSFMYILLHLFSYPDPTFVRPFLITWRPSKRTDRL